MKPSTSTSTKMNSKINYKPNLLEDKENKFDEKSNINKLNEQVLNAQLDLIKFQKEKLQIELNQSQNKEQREKEEHDCWMDLMKQKKENMADKKDREVEIHDIKKKLRLLN